MRSHRFIPRARVSVSLAAVVACCASAGAQTVATPPPAAPAEAQPTGTVPPPVLMPADRWTIKLEPQVWYVAPEGDLTLPGSAPGTAPVKLSALNAEDPEASPAGVVTIRIPHVDTHTWSSGNFWKSGWFFSAGGAAFSGDSEGDAPAGGFTIGTLTVAGGAQVETSVEWSTFYAEMGKWFAGSDFDSGGESRIDVYAVLGARVHSQDISISSGGSTTQASETFGAVLMGLRLDFKLPGDFAAIVDANVNFWPGDPSNFGFEIAPTFMWQPTQNVGIQIGYRLLTANNESGDEGGSNYYQFDGSLAGLFAGIEFRF